MVATEYSFHRPPGPKADYVDTLVGLLNRVSNAELTRTNLVNYIISDVGHVSSEKSADRQVHHFLKMGVIKETESSELALTDAGRRALEEDPREVFFSCLLETYIGFESIIQTLSKGAKTKSDIIEVLEGISPEDWEASDQGKRRLDWLESLDIIEQGKNGYFNLTRFGSELAVELGYLQQPLATWDTDIYFMSACDDDQRAQLQQSLINGIPGQAISDSYAGEKVPIWGRPNTPSSIDPTAGDWVLFYQSGARDLFTYAARLCENPFNDSDLGDWIWGNAKLEHLYLFDRVIPIDIEATWLQESVRGYRRSHVQGVELLGAGKDMGKYLLQLHYESPSDFIADHATPEYEALASQLRSNGQLILYGPPGTGKTYTAKQFWGWWHATTPNRATSPSEAFETTTFHPAYSYEDFIEGLAADTTDEGQVTYDYDQGVFLRVCESAREALETPGDRQPAYLLLVDEINRGNIPQIFGELVTQLEWDKRAGQSGVLPTSLAHSGENEFTIPSNLYLIGTMNTSDRSIALLDAALRRRFRFVRYGVRLELPAYKFGYGTAGSYIRSQTGNPDELISEWVEEAKADVNADDINRRLRALSVLALREINQSLVSDAGLDKGKQIGHTYILAGPRSSQQPTADDLRDIWHHELFPLLEEYFYGDFTTLFENVIERVHRFVDLDAQEFETLTTTELATALSRLLEEAGEIHLQDD